MTLDRIRRNPYIPWTPTPKQAAFLVCDKREVLFGGAAGGAKSAALLMGALEWVAEHRVHSLLLRRTLSDLKKADALIPLSQEWLAGTDARWNGNDYQWTFPNGATLTFGYCDHENDKYRYQGAAYNFVGFDELTQFSASQYEYIAFSRQRRRAGSDIPIKVRAASNPGGPNHEWVRQRFIDESESDRLFIPSLLDDNPHLDREEYDRSLRKLGPIEYAQLRHGDWTIRPSGDWFKRSWFEVVDELPFITSAVRYWDLAATKVRPNRNPDWTAGLLLGKGDDGFFYVIDVIRFREGPGETKVLIKQAAIADVKWNAVIWIEQEPGASGVIAADHYVREVLAGYEVYAEKEQANKGARARPVVSNAMRGGIRLLRGSWNRTFLDELETFTGGDDRIKDDGVDALSGAFGKLTKGGFLILDPDEPPPPDQIRKGWNGYSLDG